MAAEDELRKVAEDVRGLVRALRTEFRSAQSEAREATRRARQEYRSARRSRGWPPGPWSAGPWGDRPWSARPWAERPSDAAQHGEGPPRGGAGRHRPAWYAGWEHPWAWPGRAAGGAAESPREGEEEALFDLDATASAPLSRRAARPPRARHEPLPPLRHRRDGSILLGLLLVVGGLAWLSSESGVIAVSLEAALATALAVVGASMVVTARTDWGLSRRSWPVALGAVLLVALVVSANGGRVAAGLSSSHLGPVSSRPLAWSEAGGELTDLAGPITLDLTRLAAPDAGAPDQVLRVRDTFGPVTVVIPASPPAFHLHVHARSMIGPVETPGGRSDVDLNTAARPELVVDVFSRVGPVTVQVANGPPGNGR